MVHSFREVCSWATGSTAVTHRGGVHHDKKDTVERLAIASLLMTREQVERQQGLGLKIPLEGHTSKLYLRVTILKLPPAPYSKLGTNPSTHGSLRDIKDLNNSNSLDQILVLVPIYLMTLGKSLFCASVSSSITWVIQVLTCLESCLEHLLTFSKYFVSCVISDMSYLLPIYSSFFLFIFPPLGKWKTNLKL